MASRTREIWLARDRDGELYAFETKPILDGDVDFEGSIWDDDNGSAVELGFDDVFPEVTFENSPVSAKCDAWHDDLSEKDITLT